MRVSVKNKFSNFVIDDIVKEKMQTNREAIEKLVPNPKLKTVRARKFGTKKKGLDMETCLEGYLMRQKELFERSLTGAYKEAYEESDEGKHKILLVMCRHCIPGAITEEICSDLEKNNGKITRAAYYNDYMDIPILTTAKVIAKVVYGVEPDTQVIDVKGKKGSLASLI